jgi:BASS family bile acid:Na+ symporter
MMVIAYYIAQLLVSGKEQQKCITIECGLQNGTLAIFVATSIFGGGMYVIPAATYSLIMFATSLIFVYLVRKAV